MLSECLLVLYFLLRSFKANWYQPINLWSLGERHRRGIVLRCHEALGLHIFDDKMVRSPFSVKVLKMTGNMVHSLSPICVLIAIALETTFPFVAEDADRVRRRSVVGKMGQRMLEPSVEVGRVKPNIASYEDKLAWKIVAMVMWSVHYFVVQ